MTRVSIKEMDRVFLASMARSLARDIDNGQSDKRPLLEEVFDALPSAPDINDRKGKR